MIPKNVFLMLFFSSPLSQSNLIGMQKPNKPSKNYERALKASKFRGACTTLYFLITIIFLILDVEIALTLPMILIINYSNLIIWTITSITFIIILLIGLYHEWNQGMLNWSS